MRSNVQATYNYITMSLGKMKCTPRLRFETAHCKHLPQCMESRGVLGSKYAMAVLVSLCHLVSGSSVVVLEAALDPPSAMRSKGCVLCFYSIPTLF